MNHVDKNNNASVKIVSDLESLEFFQTPAHSCSYLENQSASTVFLNPEQIVGSELYSQLSDYGFRRSGAHIYKPMCANCKACVPMRIPVNLFMPSRSQKRTWKRNRDITVSTANTIDTDEHYTLYEHYITERHQDGDMYPPSRTQFQQFLSGQWYATQYYEFRVEGRLVATSVADIMDNGISAVYTYYDPTEEKRSLGSLAILFLIRQAKKRHLDSVYLGYWIKDSTKMNYKSAYRPLEIQSGGGWIIVN